MKKKIILAAMIAFFCVYLSVGYGKTDQFSGTATGWNGGNNKIRYSLHAGGSGVVIVRLRYAPGYMVYLVGADASLKNRMEKKDTSGYHEIHVNTDGGPFGVTVGMDAADGSCHYDLDVEHP